VVKRRWLYKVRVWMNLIKLLRTGRKPNSMSRATESCSWGKKVNPVFKVDAGKA
jgi:hypothetical protein